MTSWQPIISPAGSRPSVASHLTNMSAKYGLQSKNDSFSIQPVKLGLPPCVFKTKYFYRFISGRRGKFSGALNRGNRQPIRAIIVRMAEYNSAYNIVCLWIIGCQ